MVSQNRNNVKLLTPCLKDIDYFYDNLRECDIDEIKRFHGSYDKSLISYSITNSQITYTILVNDKPVCICGIIPHPANEKHGIVWSLFSKEFEKVNKRLLVKYSKEVIDLFFIYGYDILLNYISIYNTKAIRYLKTIGASGFDDDKISRVGKKEELAYTFEINKGFYDNSI